jgi:hypothetical protein
MRPKDKNLAQIIEQKLLQFHKNKRPLSGIQNAVERKVFIAQILESIRRVKYVSVMRSRPISAQRADPSNPLFDPLKAAALHHAAGNIDEACWLVFLFVHFGKHAKGGWRYAREVYGRLGTGGRWDWQSVSTNPAAFRAWLHANQAQLKRKNVPGGFGNHRKYESLSAYSATGTGAAVESYVNWIAPPRTHGVMISNALSSQNGDPRKAFDHLYWSMKAVKRFGRTARFDYLTMLGKLGLAAIQPGSTYMQEATGPVSGAKLLFGGSKNSNLKKRDLDQWLIDLDGHLNVGMQVLEDALCNWQKSPSKFKPFRG